MSDISLEIREAASAFAGVDEGTACTQSSFKVGGKAFLFIGEQGGRFKAMFKLDKSKEQALSLAQEAPEGFQAGKGPWVTARFSVEHPIAREIWQPWLEESFALTQAGKKKK